MITDPPEGPPEISAEYSPGCRLVVADLLNDATWAYEWADEAVCVCWWPQLGLIDVEVNGEELPSIEGEELKRLRLWQHVYHSDHENVFAELRRIGNGARRGVAKRVESSESDTPRSECRIRQS